MNWEQFRSNLLQTCPWGRSVQPSSPLVLVAPWWDQTLLSRLCWFWPARGTGPIYRQRVRASRHALHVPPRPSRRSRMEQRGRIVSDAPCFRRWVTQSPSPPQLPTLPARRSSVSGGGDVVYWLASDMTSFTINTVTNCSISDANSRSAGRVYRRRRQHWGQEARHRHCWLLVVGCWCCRWTLMDS